MRNNNFRDQVYKAVKKIPKGKVTTYGSIAETLGRRNWSRQVGWALHQNKQSLRSSATSAGLKGSDVPCHRVVDRNGRLASNFAFDGWLEQRRRLLEEGVKFKDEKHVNLAKCFWQENFKF